MAEIRFEKVQKKFQGTPVIKELDLTIQEGEFFTVVGPSGCGKSTLLNMIAGLEPVTDGTVYFDDTIVNDRSPRERDVAMVFQSYALYPHMSVSENIAFPLRMQKSDKGFIDEEVNRIAGLLKLEDLLSRKPKELSGGQRQRVALGRAIVRKPKVFLMDEPLSNLDARLRVEMRAELKRLHRDLKITTIYVTHDQAEALSLSERIAVLNQGELQQIGSPREIYETPANLFVGRFIGSPSMNVVPAHITNTDPLEMSCNGITLAPALASAPPGNDVTVGIRPEDVTISREPSEGAVEVIVSLTESAGSFTWVDVLWNGVAMKGTAKADMESIAGDTAYMRFPREKAVFFDTASGARLESP